MKQFAIKFTAAIAALVVLFGGLVKLAEMGEASKQVEAALTEQAGMREDAVNQQAVKEKKVRVGMNQIQVLAAWGKPDRVHKTVTARGVGHQLVYGGGYVYLTDGVVQSIQTRH